MLKNHHKMVIIGMLFLVMVLISGCLEQEETINITAECQVPLDCEGRIHVQCVGYWQCLDGKCNWQCSGDHLELPKEQGEGLTG